MVFSTLVLQERCIKKKFDLSEDIPANSTVIVSMNLSHTFFPFTPYSIHLGSGRKR